MRIVLVGICLCVSTAVSTAANLGTPKLVTGESKVKEGQFEQEVSIENTGKESIKWVVFACEFFTDDELVGEDFGLITQISAGEIKSGFMVTDDEKIEDASCGIAGFK